MANRRAAVTLESVTIGRLRKGSRVGRYTVETILAHGGSSTVYRARHHPTEEQVALKVLRRKTSRNVSAVPRLLQEARCARSIRHPNIIECRDVGRLSDGRVYLVLELLEGASLHRLLARYRRLPLRFVLSIFEQLAAALDALHMYGLVHRDIKPDNVVVLNRPPYPRIKLLDFDSAKVAAAPEAVQTEAGTVIGTPEYMAPEQCYGSVVDARTDVYGLGVLLFELVTGRRPFRGASPLDVMHMQATQPPQRPSRLVDVPASFDAVVLKALAKEPSRRFASASALVEALRETVLSPHKRRPTMVPISSHGGVRVKRPTVEELRAS